MRHAPPIVGNQEVQAIDPSWWGRFHAKVHQEHMEAVPGLGPCSIWIGGKTGPSRKTKGGYGLFSVGRKTVYAHRLILEWALGRMLRRGEFACHRCDRPACVRTDHLFISDHAGNMADMKAKGRSTFGDRNPSRLYPERRARGERHPAAKLTYDQVVEIRQRSDLGETRCALARAFDVSPASISMIARGLRWAV